jgi:ATP-dependent protease ClpP protease subunit
MNNHTNGGEDPEKDKLQQIIGMQQVLNKNLLERRMIFLWGAVEDDNARVIVEQLCYLSVSDPGKPIHFILIVPAAW